MKDVRTASYTVNIPIGLQAKTVPPIKNANFKITINSQVDTPNLQQVFSELAEVDSKYEANTSNPNALSFQAPNGVDATILVAKTSSKKIFSKQQTNHLFKDKFRIQSSTFEGLHFATIVFLEKVAKLHGKSGFLMNN